MHCCHIHHRWTSVFLYSIIIAIYQNALPYCIAILGVYSVIFWVQIRNFTEHDQTTKEHIRCSKIIF